MKLVWLGLDGFRRFAGPSRVKFDTKLVALVGPNEAGKTSVLDAVDHLYNDEPVDAGDLTRGYRPNGPIIEGAFYLEDDDRQELSDLLGGSEVRWLRISKHVGQGRQYSLEPTIGRDVSSRRILAEGLLKASKARPIARAESTTVRQLGNRFRGVARMLADTSDELTEEQLSELAALLDALRDDLPTAMPKYIQALPKRVEDQIAVESGENPWNTAVDRLESRLPSLALFDSASRSLRSSYDLATVGAAPPAALANLANVAGLSLTALLQSAQSDNQADVHTRQVRANAELERKFGEAWHQSGVRVAFQVVGTTLNIQMRDEADRFSTLDERSDGLRQFVALLAFCLHERLKDPLLLIDEAETHLHYDAQADLVDMLSRQQVARQVIYTTHSIGCLPEDLGSGVRLVGPSGSSKSRIQNRFWSEGGDGFTPILFGMGATTLAFFPVRFALVVEGMSDLLLLPRILKTVARRDFLGFQVVPGLAEASREQIPVLAAHGKRVLYLVDNDPGGRALGKWLVKQGIDTKQVFEIASKRSNLADVEGFVDRHLLASAVTLYLRRWSKVDAECPVAAVGEPGSHAQIAAWCGKQGYPVPGKVDLAYAVLEVLHENPGTRLVSPKRFKAATALASGLSKAFVRLAKPKAP